MEKSLVSLPKVKLIGIKVRTNNLNETDPSTAKIAGLVQKYYRDRISEIIPNRKNPNTTLIVYTEYESNQNGDYTCFMGEEVTSFDDLENERELSSLTIPSQKYARFTTERGPILSIVIKAWKQIWALVSHKKLGAKRAYIADIEVYDERTSDPQNSIVDIYIGLKK